MLKNRKKIRLEKILYQNGYFFVTINVKNNISYFGEIINDEIILSEYGKIVEQCWLWLGQQYNYVILDEYVIMPNHFHGIIIIDNVGNGRDRSLQKDDSDRSLQKIKGLSSIIGAFKTISSKQLHQSGLTNFSRQKSFYDHIVRNEQDLQRIQEYILNNPYKRKNDEYYN